LKFVGVIWTKKGAAGPCEDAEGRGTPDGGNADRRVPAASSVDHGKEILVGRVRRQPGERS